MQILSFKSQPLRPSGMMMHKRPGAKPTDDWGVQPSEGYKVELSEEVWKRLQEARSRREFYPPQADASPPSDPQLEKAVECLKEKS